MRTLRKAQQKLYYCLLDPENEITIYDEYGNETSETIKMYAAPAEMWANVSPAAGTAEADVFGNLPNYDKVLVTDWIDCPIDEDSVLFIDKEPEFTEGQTMSVTESQTLLGDDTVETVTYQIPKHDYIVRRVAKSMNYVAIAVQKVTVS